MFSFNGLAQSLGMRPFSTRPELHREIVLCFASTDSSDANHSSISCEFIRGWYTTWIEGPRTRGCGMHSETVRRIDPGADREWNYSMVFLYSGRIQIEHAWMPGVVDETVFEDSAWWAYCDDPIHGMSLAQYMDLDRGSCKTKLKHDGVFYPRKL